MLECRLIRVYSGTVQSFKTKACDQNKITGFFFYFTE